MTNFFIFSLIHLKLAMSCWCGLFCQFVFRRPLLSCFLFFRGALDLIALELNITVCLKSPNTVREVGRGSKLGGFVCRVAAGVGLRISPCLHIPFWTSIGFPPSHCQLKIIDDKNNSAVTTTSSPEQTPRFFFFFVQVWILLSFHPTSLDTVKQSTHLIAFCYENNF